MAFIYRYYIKDKEIREKNDLIEFSGAIMQVIEEFYKDNLKDCRVEKEYYEYKLHLNEDNKRLREFGKKLMEKCPMLRALWNNRRNQMNSGFFVRRIQEYYGFINREEDKGISGIELIDVIDFQDPERFANQANIYLDKYLKHYNMNSTDNDNILDINSDTIARNFYMDVFSLYMSEDDRKKFLNGKVQNSAEILLIKGYHHRNIEESSVTSELDADQLKNSEVSDDNNKTLHDESLVDGFKILSMKKLDKSEVQKIKKDIHTHINSVQTISSIQMKNYKDINFVVHNVGQALSTSLSLLKKPPFLYFDFGVSEGRNAFNRPKSMSVDVTQKPSIVISHIHKDHWYGITVFTKAFECDWYIPRQRLGAIFTKRCAEIIVSGGSVNYITSPIIMDYGTIFLSGDSRYEPGRTYSHKHDNGIAMKIKLYSSKESKDVNILVAGDQRYDYMPENYLKDIDILVASHHGGIYSWSDRSDVYEEIPISTGTGQVIYSYGKDNTHNHPSKVDEYELKGWKISHMTPNDLDYKLK
jgi:hypothetical protein